LIVGQTIRRCAFILIPVLSDPTVNIVFTDAKAAADFGATVTLFEYQANSVIFDNSKIKRFVPDYVATIPFRKGIIKTVQWFDAKATRIRIDDKNNRLMDSILTAYQGD